MLTFASFIIARATSIANHFPIFLSFVTLTCQYRFLHQTTFHKPNLLHTLCHLCKWVSHGHVVVLYQTSLYTASRLARSSVHVLTLCYRSNLQSISSSRSRCRFLSLISNSYGTRPSRLNRQWEKTFLYRACSLRSIHLRTLSHHAKFRDHNHVEHHFTTSLCTLYHLRVCMSLSRRICRPANYLCRYRRLDDTASQTHLFYRFSTRRCTRYHSASFAFLGHRVDHWATHQCKSHPYLIL